MLERKTIQALEWIIGIINRKNIPYQVSGGLAAKMYGSKRVLNDIDIDLSEDLFECLLPEIEPYIIYGPDRYRDGKWDLWLITLNFNGQEIDISGTNKTSISNKDRTEWMALQTDFLSSVIMEIEGLRIQVAHPEWMIAYKEHLDGDHQVEDIQAMKKALESGLFSSIDK